MFKNLKVKTKLNIAFITVFIISMAVIGLVMQTISSRMLSDQIFSHLETVVSSKANQVEIVLKMYEQRARLITSKTWLRRHLKSYLETGDEGYKTKVEEILTDTQIENPKFLHISIIDTEGQIIISTNKNLVGKDISKKDFFINGKKSYAISDFHYPEHEDNSRLHISGPLILNEEFLGVVAVASDGKTLENAVAEHTGLGESGEVYLINKESYMITPSRFKEDTFLKQKIETVGTKHCFSQHSTEEHSKASIYLDYRGVSVLGSHIYFKEMGWCLLTEIDEKEAMAPTLEILWAYLIVVAIFTIIYLLLVNWVARMITRPIMKLHRGTEIIEKGNLNYRVGFEGGGEIGQLARSFDKMTIAIKKSRAEVDKKVANQTKDIINKKIELEKQQKAILNILEDVENEKERTKKERDKIDIILHSIGDGVFVVDKNLKITMINQIALDLCKYSGDEAMGSQYGKILKFVSEKTSKTNDKFIKNALKTGQIQEMENHTLLVRHDGTKIPVSDSAAPFRDRGGNIAGCVVVFRDVSKEREVDKMKTEFVSIASHQLRTPLTSISWFTEMLLSKDVGKLTKKQEEYLNQVYNSNKRMIKLVNDLLNVSRIETGKMVIAPEMTQIEDLMKTVLDEIEVLAKSNKISVTFKKPKSKLPKIKLDFGLISQIVQNLLSNAIRYNKKNGKVVMTVDKIDKEFLITVADTGIGIPTKDQKKMFLKFFRADNAIKKQADGNGLGLYVNRAILEASGGKIWFESQESKGTTFYVTIPIAGMKAKKGSRLLVKS